jgi:hypothetical protein
MSANTALGVRKPVWLRICGWTAFVLFAVPISIPIVELVSRYHIPRTVWPGFCLLAFFPLAGVWCLGSVVYSVQRKQAQLTAAALMHAERARHAAPPIPGVK